MKRHKTTLWLSFGLACVTVCLAMSAYILGLVPDGYKTELNARAKVAEALAVQLAGAVSRNDSIAVEETLTSVVKRNPDILSVAFRNKTGEILLSRGDHGKHWIVSVEESSTPTHIFVPLIGADGPQGRIEIAFEELPSGARIFDIPVSLLLLLGFLATTGFLVYSLFLRRALHELDPGRIIPERVQKAFDTLSEGVIILDERERILLVNSSFAKMYGEDHVPAIGSKINAMPWRMVDSHAIAGGYPWHTAIHEGREMREDVISLRTADGVVRNLNVNATVFTGDKKETIGAIVTLSDTTDATRNAEQLSKAIGLLQQTQEQVKRQKQELDYLSNHDPMTGCLNRTAFFAAFETDLELARQSGQSAAALMLDVDGLRDTKANYGPAVADSLVTAAANALRTTLPKNVSVARYGGEGFCVALFGLNLNQVIETSLTIQSSFCQAARSAAPQLDHASLSVGIAEDSPERCSVTELVRRADEVMHLAMSEGAGNIGQWTGGPDQSGSVAQISSGNASNSAPDKASIHQINLEMKEADRIEAYREQARFLETATRSIDRAACNENPLAILKIGVASWDFFEEALGEDLSHTLLRFAGQKVQLALREQDNVVLIPETGEMLVELAELDQTDDVTWIAKRIQDGFHDPLKVGEQTVYVICKIGAALFPSDGRDASELSRHAAVALRRAREENSLEGLTFYSAEMTQNSYENLDIETGTRAALQNNEFEMFFQPIIDIQDGAVKAVETLLRCTSTRLAGVRIDQIIDVAERSSLITEIDGWVFNAALSQMTQWDQAGVHLPKISINLSAKQLTNLEFMDSLFDKIEAVPFSPSRIQVEVTETARMANVEAAAPQLKRLQQIGVHIALDDFGTGQSSLTYLQRLHPDVIKIDRSFVDGINKNHANATMVSAMTVMAHCLGLRVVAEGVETEEELGFLRETGCNEIQGYLISKPLPSAAMTEWIGLFSRYSLASNSPAEDVPLTETVSHQAA